MVWVDKMADEMGEDMFRVKCFEVGLGTWVMCYMIGFNMKEAYLKENR
jgi:hypothetical protein